MIIDQFLDRLKKLAGIKKQYWKAGGIPYCFKDGELYVCLVTSTNPIFGGSHPSIPKGNPDNDETPIECAVREVTEETGIEHFNNVTALASIQTKGVYDKYMLHVFAMQTTELSKLLPDYEGIPEWYLIDVAITKIRPEHKIFLTKLVEVIKTS
jgi:8-oxo-dGTP pyrophosphatase MutT (NUDIX family)